MADADHPFVKPSEDASRSPCPALNSLANHGYLPRDGNSISLLQLRAAIMQVYGLSGPLATVLAGGAVLKCGNGLTLNLKDLAAHNQIEHDASMAHLDINEGNQGVVNQDLVDAMVADTDNVAATEDDFIKMKIRREKQNNVKYTNGRQQTVSRGEIALTMKVMVDHATGLMPVEWLRSWFGEERLPAGFKPPPTIGLFDLQKHAQAINKKIDDLTQTKG